jgi:ParB family chromosome partitioning protein
MLSVVRDVPDEVVLKIGPAPAIGRDRWFDFAKQARMADGSLDALRAFLDQPEIAARESDERFTAASGFLREAGQAPRRADKGERILVDPGSRRELGSIQRSDRWVTIKIAAKEQRGFADWLESHADDLISELHARYAEGAGAKD